MLDYEILNDEWKPQVGDRVKIKESYHSGWKPFLDSTIVRRYSEKYNMWMIKSNINERFSLVDIREIEEFE